MAVRFLSQVQVLAGPDQPLHHRDVLLEDGVLIGFDQAAADESQRRGLVPLAAHDWLLAPALVDPHSTLEEPFSGQAETLASLVASAAAAGYGTVALLPRAASWRDRPERLQLQAPDPFTLPLWGAFSRGGRGQELAPHGDLAAAGAIGLAEDGSLPPLALLERGLRLSEAGALPVLLAPRDPDLTLGGFVRESVEALRAGWPLDPVLSETLPLQILLQLARSLPDAPLRLANLSTAAGVELLRSSGLPLQASVCWWHLVADSGCLDPLAEGWRLEPSLGSPEDRHALIEALADGVLTAVAVHHLPLDAEERLLPLDQRRPGLAGHRQVLPALWQELVVKRGWSPALLWERLCWGPTRLLGLAADTLEPGSRRWLLFDPAACWQVSGDAYASRGANQPFEGESLTGQVLATGLLPELWRGPLDRWPDGVEPLA